MTTHGDEPIDTGLPEQSLKARRLALCSSAEARGKVPYALARQLEVLPIGLISTNEVVSLAVACAEGREAEVRTALRFATGLAVRPVPLKRDEVLAALAVAYCGDAASLEHRISVLKDSASKAPFVRDSAPPRSYSPAEVPSFLRATMRYAMAHRASDIHFSPSHEGTRLSMRIDGELAERSEIVASRSQHEHLVRHIKVLAGLDSAQHLSPQDGVLHSESVFRDPREAQDLGCAHARVSTMPTQWGERVVLRLTGSARIPELSALGFSEEIYDQIHRAIALKEGVILFCGSTGSGKSTSLYALMRQLSAAGQAVSSIEDPVEVTLPGVAQTAVLERAGLSYETCLRAVLRQDPDVIMVGEIRTTESARMVMSAAETGHLILSTVHGTNPQSALRRIESLGVPKEVWRQAVRLVVHQELLAVLCPACRVTDLKLSQRLGFEAFRPVGCGSCGYRGYVGRRLVAGALVIGEHSETPLCLSAREHKLTLAREGIIAGKECEVLP